MAKSTRSPRRGRREPLPHRRARVQDRAGVDVGRALGGQLVDRDARRLAHEPHDVLEPERLRQVGEAEELVGVVVDEHPDVPEHVVVGVARGAGDPAGHEGRLELLRADTRAAPALVERRQTLGVRSDNVHGSIQRTREFV